MKNQNTPSEFIIALTEHRLFGFMLVPYLIQPNDMGTFYTIVSPVLKREVDATDSNYSPVQKKLVSIIENYSDESLARKFSRDYGSKEFFHKVSKEYFNKYVSPYIDKQIVACLDIIKENNIPLYRKPAKYTNVYDEDRIEIAQNLAEPIFHFRLTPEGLTYTLQILQDNEKVKIYHRKVQMVADTPCRIVIGNQMYAFRNISWKKLFPFIDKEMVTVPASVTEKYMNSFVLNAIRDNHVRTSGFDIKSVEAETKAIIVLERGLDYCPMLTLMFQYGAKQFMAGNKSLVEVELTEQNGRYVFLKHARDMEWENSILHILDQLGAKLNASQLVLKKDINPLGDELKFITINWLNRNTNELKAHNIFIDQKMDVQSYYTGLQNLVLNMKSENDWFDLYAVVEFGEFKIPFIRLKKYILQGKREFELPNGEIAILPIEWFTKYSGLMHFAQSTKEHMRFSKVHFQLLAEQGMEMDDSVKKELDKLDPKNFELIEVPKGLNATLRDYQKLGLSWMYFLGKNKFGGCLADDMGLGKTLQTIGLILKNIEDNNSNTDNAHKEEPQGTLFPENKKSLPASLVIMPTSLVHNWKNELTKFAPQLKVYCHVGSNRRKPTMLNQLLGFYDVVLSSYGTIRNDYEQMKDAVFNYIILDESQNIKNSESKTYQAVCELSAKHRLVLTGTPIENSLSDLWSQVNFLNPGILGNLNFFKKEFIQPIEKKNDEDVQKQLIKIITPILLRRKKEEVAKDLPSLTEQIRYCEMSELQQKIYEEQKSVIRNSLLENIEAHGLHKSTFMVLQGITKLRQLANHPSLVGEKDTGSGKFDEVMSSLHNLMAEKHKVLIFSSFVKHLELFKTEIEKEGWGYSLLTGQTRDRQEVIRAFQEDSTNRIFLISLKAGGVGLNLTSADYIFILDPWWNPAAESQAISRAHRIGQDKKVFVYRFITEETIEEKIQALKERKSTLAEKFVETTNPFKAFTKEDILNLF